MLYYKTGITIRTLLFEIPPGPLNLIGPEPMTRKL